VKAKVKKQRKPTVHKAKKAHAKKVAHVKHVKVHG